MTQGGKRDFAIRGRSTTGAFTSAPKVNVAANSWRPHKDSNLCYRRERAITPALNLNATRR